MQPVIISDASCLILLEKISELELLQKLYSQVHVTQIIADEFKLPLPNWIIVQNPVNIARQQVLELSVDRGEASAIALAEEQIDCLLIMDDLPGRKLARQLQLTVTGTLGIIGDAKLYGIIPSVKPILSKLQQTNFRISQNLIAAILKKAGE